MPNLFKYVGWRGSDRFLFGIIRALPGRQQFARSSARRTMWSVSRDRSLGVALRANEYSACSAVRAISTQVRGQGFAYIRREGHPVVQQPLARTRISPLSN